MIWLPFVSRALRQRSLMTAVVQLLSHVRLFETSWTPGFSVPLYLPEFAQTHVH